MALGKLHHAASTHNNPTSSKIIVDKIDCGDKSLALGLPLCRWTAGKKFQHAKRSPLSGSSVA
eukprot:11405920-Ditylum_brightwellii.AAC.1